jgi:mono/diheme cytochrome c family protein
MATRKESSIWLLSLGLWAAGCSGESTPTSAPTYHGAIKAIVQTRCEGCHQVGGVAPFTLDSYESVKAFSRASVAAIEAGTMPPWMPDPECRHYIDERLVPDEEKAIFRQWVDAETPAGDPADFVAPDTMDQALTLASLGQPSAELKYPEAYSPDPGRPDDYRCFPMAMEFNEETFLRTTNVVPDQVALVHHVILYLVAPAFAGQVDNLDAEDDGPGYGCFGGVGVGSPTPIAGWVPGNTPLLGSTESGIRIPPGSKLVMQMHYSSLSTQPSPDQTRVDMWFLDQQPEYVLAPRFLPHLGIDIAADDPSSKHERIFRNNSDKPWTIVSTSPHMHLLGQSQRVDKLDTNGNQKECLVDVPAWDFNWQQGYVLKPTQPMVVRPGESLRVECTYDNSAANQPLVNGQRRTSQRIGWGEGTLDEMCLNTIILLEPYEALPQMSESCQEFQGCYDQCLASPFPLTGCILTCGATDGCASCLLPGVFTATADKCGVQGAALIECLEYCSQPGSDPECVTDSCGLLVVGFDGCARVDIEGGIADRTATACGVEL